VFNPIGAKNRRGFGTQASSAPQKFLASSPRKGDIMRNTVIIRGLLFALVLMAIPANVPTASAAFGFGVAITIAPPALPVYEQPVCPGDGYIWTPGYWAYGTDGYFWVPGTWVIAPRIGFLWTPGYWGWGGGGYFWHAGYWGPHVGFYGGINYGFGYGGFGYEGGYWRGGHFFYNRGVNNVDIHNVHNVYNRTVVNNREVNRVSYNGGRGGLSARPTEAEMAANRDPHIGATGMQKQQEHFASTNRAQFASVNHGQPGTAASARPGEFSNRGATASNNFNRGANAARSNTNNATRASNRAARSREATRENAVTRSQNNARQSSRPAVRQNASRPATRSNSVHAQSHSARSAAPKQSHSNGGSHGGAPHAAKSGGGGSHGGGAKGGKGRK
jgi:hypothetical protein